MQKKLQNHPNYRDYPVSSFKVIKNILSQGNGIKALISLPLFALSSLATIVACLGVAATWVIFSELISTNFHTKTGLENQAFIYIVPAITFVLILFLLFVAYHIFTIPKKEQLRYYQQAGIKELSIEQKQAIALCRVDDYFDGFWSETLEHYPLKSRVNNDAYAYKTMYLSLKLDHVKQVYSDWNIVDKNDYLQKIEELTKGMHSFSFLFNAVYYEQDFEIITKRIAALTETDEAYVRSCLESKEGCPPRLLWGFDLWRAIILSRNCFCAEIISEEEAWQDILRVSNYIYALFDNFDDFYLNYRLGNAFWSNDIDRVKTKLEHYQVYKKDCRWPAAKLAWPDVAIDQLPLHMQDGFEERLASYNENIEPKMIEQDEEAPVLQ